MILNEKNKKPILTFGLGRKSLTTPIGSTIRVEQIQILSPENYTLYYNDVEVSLYGFEFNALDLGKQNFSVKLVNNITGLEIFSDAIELEMTLKADSNFITADSNSITADGSRI